jgi:hypothetical protein
MAYLTDWRILLAFLLLVIGIATMLYSSEKRQQESPAVGTTI